MTNFSVNFTNAWWLLLLIPAFALTLISYFKLNKRYRCTRNRIVSIVMHLVVMVLATALLAGMTLEYMKPNTEVEVILLVDYSYTLEDSENEVDDFIKDVIDNCNSKYKLGVVKFGYDQVYAVELTNDMTKVYSGYLTSADPDTTATDIASALTYASSLFKNAESSRIVLISDALETDSEASTIIKSLSANGIHVDTVYFPGEALESEVQILGADASVSKVEVNSKFDINLTLQSSYEGEAVLKMYDNGMQQNEIPVTLKEGFQTVTIPYEFVIGDLHVMTYELTVGSDTIEQNNRFTSYFNIPIFSKILVIESIDDESRALAAMMEERLEATVVNITDDDNIPQTLDELREYDEVILVNISNAQLQLHEGFDALLQQYVQEIGGGLFTICGNTKDSTHENWTANAYQRKDMYRSIYQDMLPVEIVEYTPPAGVIIIVDASGSMLNGGKYEDSKLNYAIDGARACLDALSERDYIGIMTLSDFYSEALTLTPCAQRDKALSAIASLEHSITSGTLSPGGTIYSTALKRACTALSTRTDLDKKHIILVTDGEPSSTDTQDYLFECRELKAAGITMSIYGIDATSSGQACMRNILKESGNSEEYYHNVTKGQYGNIAEIMRNDLNTPRIEEVNYETFVPTISMTGSVTSGVLQEDMPELDGYYGVKKKKDATVYLMGQYSPIYTQWDYGKGRVGTFACDLNGTWSADFVESEVGALLINNIINALVPSEDIRATDIEASFTGDNYTTKLSIYTDLLEDQRIRVTVIAPDETEEYYYGDLITGYSRMTVAIKNPGLNKIRIEKLDKDGNPISEKTLYKVISYSKEYEAFRDIDAAEKLMKSLSDATKGVVITEPAEVFENAVEYLKIVLDPRILFAILIIILFLIDIAVRKFKWKWIHEIINEKRRKSQMTK